MENTKTNHSRRIFLKSSALVGGGFLLHFSGLAQFAVAERTGKADAPAQWTELNGYIKIMPDNLIKILCPNPEFGQNVMTSLPMIVAEELDVDWQKVVVEMGPHDSVKLGSQFTAGSNSIKVYWRVLREAGATARYMLVQAAAQTWGVPAEEVTTKASMLYHEKTGKKGKYGEFASKAAGVTLGEGVVKLKELKNFNVVRNSKKNVEGSKIISGKPLFGLDYTHPGMLIAMIHHPPAFGMKLKSFDAAQALKMPGITNIFSMKLYEDSVNDLLVVVGKNTWEVMNARKKLVVEWEATDIEKGGELEDTIAQHAKMREYAAKPAQQLRKDGDPETAFKNAAQIIERTYSAPFLAHNCMEPMNFFAHVTDEKALLVGPLQMPDGLEPTLMRALKLPADKIEIQMTRMGGGFGRRAAEHYVVEAALISKKTKAPIKLIYSREDDITYGIYRPMYTTTYRAALDADKKLIGFHVKGGGIPSHSVRTSGLPAGAIDNYLAEGWRISSKVTTGIFRAPASNFAAAAEQSFLDELAEAMGKDPIDFRLELLKRVKENPVGKSNDYNPDRYAAVLQLVKEKSGWTGAGHGKYSRGVAAYFCHNSYVAHVVDMTIKNGQPYVERVFSAVDCGIVINPDAAANMVQGAVVDGIGSSLYGGLTLKAGVVKENNFHKYRMIRMPDAPKKIEVSFVQNDIDPTGLGEPPFPPIFGAVANALFKATGKRYYEQPFLLAK